jgi:signal peptidase I
MQKNRPTPARNRRPPERPPRRKIPSLIPRRDPHADWWRETIEAIVVALILAFLFRTFEAEAFVIPTGSMAPTLLGRHKDVHCEQCGYQFTIGASDEVDINGYLMTDHRVNGALCPNCRYPIPKEQVLDAPVFTGDRILVNKFPYEFSEPKRFDVLVFKYPEEPKTNYIKRLIGLPGETIEIRQGDVYLITPDGPKMLRKDDPLKQREIQILVYDNDRPEKALHQLGWPERWAPVRKDAAPGAVAGWSQDSDGWQADVDARSFEIDRDRSSKDLRWVRYRHFVPNEEDWIQAKNGRPTRTPRPQLITDFCGYNAYSNGQGFGHNTAEEYWVGDLTVNCQVDVKQLGPEAELVFELNEGARKYRCRISPETGKARLSFPDPLNREEDAAKEVELGTAQTPLKGTGTYRVTFANADNRLAVWVNDLLIDFGPAASYEPFAGLPRQGAVDDDLIPIGIAARGVTAKVSHLLVQRDIYYRCEFWHPANEDHRDELGRPTGLEQNVEEYDGSKIELERLLTNPKAWYQEYDGLTANKTVPESSTPAFRFLVLWTTTNSL